MFKASKYRNVLGSNVPREEWYEELQLDADRLDVYPIAATASQLAFPSQLNGGASIEIKPTTDTGKANAIQKPTSLLKGHTQRVNALAYATYLPSSSTSILASGGDDTTVKLWDTSSSSAEGDSSPLWSFENAESSTRVVGVSFHPSASDVLGVAMSKTVAVLDVHHQQAVHTSFAHPHIITGFTWNSDGSAVATVCQDNVIRVWDPRGDAAGVATATGHQGRKAAAVTWLHPGVFLTAGFNTLQERELMVWDARKLDKSVARERMDTGTGLVMPSFDPDTNLLFVAGRGDKIIRTYELNVAKAPVFSALQSAATYRPTWGVASLPKRACAFDKCEVARLVVVEQGNVIEPISYTVPRRDAANQFQADLYPDSRTNTAAMTAADWASGRDAAPMLGKVDPTASITAPPTPPPLDSKAPSSSHISTTTTTTSSTASWNSGSGWASATPLPTTILTPDIDTTATAAPVTTELSEKARKLGAIQGNKFKYITGKPLARSESYVNVPASDAALLVANSSHWATPIVGTGGPVLVHPLASPGKIENGVVLNNHKLPVTDLDFHPFHPHLLATASDDGSIRVSDYTKPNGAAVVASLDGHDKGIRCLAFHPSADNVVASGSMDCTIRLWDVEAQSARQVIQKFEDAPLNVSFNFDGSLLATVSRDKVLRVVDPRANKTVSMACAHEGTKAQKVVWCSQNQSSTLVTVGFSSRSERQVFVWDARNLLDPLSKTTLDTSGSTLLPYYDESSNVLYLVSRGDRSIFTYEIDAATRRLESCAPFSYTGAPIAGAALLPKHTCNIREVEVARFLVLTKSTIDPVTFSLPRADKLKQFFQDDVYGVVRTYSSGVSPADWFDGADHPPATASLCPAGMPVLSERELDGAPVVPKVINFQAQKQREDNERIARDEQFQRLHALASQPTLHNQGAKSHPNDDDEDDDDGWDD